MKSIKFIVIALVAAIALISAGVAMAGIKDSKHDLSTGNATAGVYKNAGTSEICVFCHTPHSGGTLVPLWNRTTTTLGFTLYTSPTGTLDATDLGQPGGASLACMSCHDGTLALSVLTNQPTPAASAGVDAGGVVADLLVNGTAALGKDLSNDHPVSFTFDATLASTDGGLNDPTALSLAKLFGIGSNQVECASCHNVHDNTTAPPFLRASNANSALCLDCHNK